MSEENRPNLNAVGLMVDILAAIEKRMRGNAKKAGMKTVTTLIGDDVTKLVERIDESFNQYFGM